MTLPDTCGASGGAISVWFRVTYCNHLGSIVTTWQNLTSGGSTIYCSVQHVTLVNIYHSIIAVEQKNISFVVIQ